MNVQVIARPDGTLLWFSRATPGRTHDLTSARAHGIIQACLTRQVLVLADRAHQGAGVTVRTPYYHHSEQPEHYQQFNRDHARLRAPGERAFRRSADHGRRYNSLGLRGVVRHPHVQPILTSGEVPGPGSRCGPRRSRHGSGWYWWGWMLWFSVA
ncbi:hypothetical protein QFZ32_000623 [Streptomyces canus]|nr:hypothetical protein [Streptomyces canus]